MRLRHSEKDYSDAGDDLLNFDDVFGIAPETPLGQPDMDAEPMDPPPMPPPEPDPEPHVAPEFKVSNVLKRQDEMKAAQREDRKRQDSDDLRMLLLAAGTRKSPQLRNLGTSNMDALLQQYKMQPKASNPMEQERKLLELQKLRDSLKKPDDPFGLHALDKQLKEKALAKEKDPPKPSSYTKLDPANRDYWEGKLGQKLPPNATLEDVKTLQGAIENPKASRGIAAAGLGIQKTKLEDAHNEKAAEAEGTKVSFGGKTWSPPAGWKNEPAAKEIQAKARNSAVVIAGLSELDKLFDEAASNKTSPGRRAAIESRIGILAPQMNVAVGQGAMAENEFARVKQSTGDIGSTDFWLGGLKETLGGQNVMKARINAAKQAFRSSFEETAKASRWAPEGGQKQYRRVNGKWEEVGRDG